MRHRAEMNFDEIRVPRTRPFSFISPGCSISFARNAVKVTAILPARQERFLARWEISGCQEKPRQFPRRGRHWTLMARRTRQRPASSGSRLDHLRFMELCCSPDLWPMKADRRSCRSTVSKSGLMGGGGRTQGTQQKLARCRCRAGLRSLLAIPGTRRRRSPANRWLDL
jgi:hypothetical protein